MIDDTTLLFSAWLRGDIDDTASVNRLIPQIPRRGTDPEPAPLLAVYDDITDDNIILGHAPTDVPSITVFAGSDPGLHDLAPGQQTLDHAEKFWVGIGLADQGALEVATVKAAHYRLKAVRKSLRLLNNAPMAQRTYGGVLLVKMTRMIEQRLGVVKGHASLVGVVVVWCTVQELAS